MCDINDCLIDISKLDLYNRCHGLVAGFKRCVKDSLEKHNLTLLAAALDSVFLTEGMLRTFLSCRPPVSDFARDLWFYGALQALVVQQDSMAHIGGALGLKPGTVDDFNNVDPAFSKIRIFRNRASGHPVVNKHKKQGRVYGFSGTASDHFYAVVQITCSPDGEDLVVEEQDLGGLVAIQLCLFLKIVGIWEVDLKARLHKCSKFQVEPENRGQL